jgi:hypothetical protein
MFSPKCILFHPYFSGTEFGLLFFFISSLKLFPDKATEAKPDTGKGKKYQVPEYFSYNPYSYFDFEKDMLKQRNPQPKSGLTEFW